MWVSNGNGITSDSIFHNKRELLDWVVFYNYTCYYRIIYEINGINTMKFTKKTKRIASITFIVVVGALILINYLTQ